MGVGGEGKGHSGDVTRPDDQKLDPSEEKPGPGPVGTAEIDIVSTCAGIGAGKLSIAQRAAKGKQPSDYPNQKYAPTTAGAPGDVRSHLIYSNADNDAHNQVGGIKQ